MLANWEAHTHRQAFDTSSSSLLPTLTMLHTVKNSFKNIISSSLIQFNSDHYDTTPAKTVWCIENWNMLCIDQAHGQQAWAHEIFIFRTEKIWNFRTFFSISESQKNAFFVISGAYNFGTFTAEAKITVWRHEVVYRLSSERKMIDLEWALRAILMLKSGTTLLSLCPVLLTHK